MAAQTFSARAIAREASKVMGRTVTDKQVRGLARDTIARFDKTKHPAYQSHEYSATERKSLLAVFSARAGKGRTARPTNGQTGTARKSRATARASKASPDAAE
jgi:hypothetical protein